MEMGSKFFKNLQSGTPNIRYLRVDNSENNYLYNPL